MRIGVSELRFDLGADISTHVLLPHFGDSSPFFNQTLNADARHGGSVPRRETGTEQTGRDFSAGGSAVLIWAQEEAERIWLAKCCPARGQGQQNVQYRMS